MSEYETALARGKQLGASKADDAAAMALFCDSSLQLLVGAVSPSLIWQGARSTGLTLLELARLANADPAKVADLMWV